MSLYIVFVCAHKSPSPYEFYKQSSSMDSISLSLINQWILQLNSVCRDDLVSSLFYRAVTGGGGGGPAFCQNTPAAFIMISFKN